MRQRNADTGRNIRVQDTALWHGALLEIQRLARRIDQLESQLISHGITPIPSDHATASEDTLVIDRKDAA